MFRFIYLSVIFKTLLLKFCWSLHYFSERDVCRLQAWT